MTISHVTVGKYLEMARQAGITWPLPDDIDDARLEQRLYASVPQAASDKPIMPPTRSLWDPIPSIAPRLSWPTPHQ
jgi:hypothetical protein